MNPIAIDCSSLHIIERLAHSLDLSTEDFVCQLVRGTTKASFLYNKSINLHIGTETYYIKFNDEFKEYYVQKYKEYKLMKEEYDGKYLMEDMKYLFNKIRACGVVCLYRENYKEDSELYILRNPPMGELLGCFIRFLREQHFKTSKTKERFYSYFIYNDMKIFFPFEFNIMVCSCLFNPYYDFEYRVMFFNDMVVPYLLSYDEMINYFRF